MLPVLLVLGLNMFLATSWGTGFLERRIESRLGLPCAVDAVSWSPWAGVQVKDLRLKPPLDVGGSEEILKIELLKVDLSWRSLAKGRKRFQRVEIQGVTGDVSLELLQSLLARGQAPPKAVPVGPSTPTPAGSVDDSETPPEVTPPMVDSRPKPAEGGETVVDDPVKPEPELVPVDDFEGLIAFERVNLRIFSERFPDFSAGVSGVSGEIPVWGPEREGLVAIGDFEIAGRYHSQAIEVPVTFKDGFIKVDDHEVKMFGLDMSVTAALWMVQGLPYGVQLKLPSQQMDLSPIYVDGKPPFTIGALQSSGEIKGHLLHPGESTGGLYATFQDLELIDKKDGSKTGFQSGLAHFQLSAAGLNARDCRILGEEEAVLANGFATPGGDVAAVVRIVASPNRANAHENRVRLASDQFELEFEPLVTPDREFRDLHLEVRAGDLMIDLGQERQWVPFFPAVRAIAGSRDPNISLYP
ncbi:hypothetical protein V2O64_08915 [Verrucomicrobiaceae bacterium 227]